jgi:hypothetical protein
VASTKQREKDGIDKTIKLYTKKQTIKNGARVLPLKKLE